VLSLFSCGDERVLTVVLEDGREESRELARRVRHADGDGEMCSPNSLNEGGGTRRRPKVDQFPKRWMKPLPLGVMSPAPEGLLERLAFGESGSPLAGGADNAFGCCLCPVAVVGRLLAVDNPRRTGGGRPRRAGGGSETNSSGSRPRSGYIFRVAGADCCIDGSLAGCSPGVRPMGVGVVGVVTVVDGVGAERTD
jgi:hypothetical protein